MAAKFMRELADIFDEGIGSQEIVPQDSISSCKYHLNRKYTIHEISI